MHIGLTNIMGVYMGVRVNASSQCTEFIKFALIFLHIALQLLYPHLPPHPLSKSRRADVFFLATFNAHFRLG